MGDQTSLTEIVKILKMAPNIQQQVCLEISYNMNMLSMKPEELVYKIECYQCHHRYKDNQKNIVYAKCGSKFIETKLLQRELAPTNPAINHQRRALWINAFGRIQAAPVKAEPKTVSNDLLLIQRTEKATEEKECSICMDMIRIGDKFTSSTSYASKPGLKHLKIHARFVIKKPLVPSSYCEHILFLSYVSCHIFSSNTCAQKVQILSNLIYLQKIYAFLYD